MKVAVVDGRGGGIGSLLVRKLKEAFGEQVEVVALGTNAIATWAMMRAKANRGATGEGAVVRMAREVDLILGTIDAVLPQGMMGELTPRMAEAIASAPAYKVLLPLSQERLEVVGVQREPLPHLVDRAMERVRELLHV